MMDGLYVAMCLAAPALMGFAVGRMSLWDRVRTEDDIRAARIGRHLVCEIRANQLMAQFVGDHPQIRMVRSFKVQLNGAPLTTVTLETGV